MGEGETFMSYFKKVLIANRGEIARRVIRTCKRLGIQTVAVYSEADTMAPFVEEADEAVCIGPAQAKKSYLNIEKVIEAAKQTGADGVHPGYGFLSENADFAHRLEQEGITFIGPDAKIIELMGSKIESRRQMKNAGVPVVPGWDGSLESVEEALELADQIGYPLMLKASAGGGGIGMTLVQNSDELKNAFATTKQRAASAFGDGTLFLEKFITNPRHIEVQVAGDHQMSNFGLHFIKFIGHRQEATEGRLDDFFSGCRLFHRGSGIFCNMQGRLGDLLHGFGQLLGSDTDRTGFAGCCLHCIEDVLDLIDLHDQLEHMTQPINYFVFVVFLIRLNHDLGV